MISDETMEKIKPGAQVKVHELIKEGEKEKTSVFGGLVIARKHGREIGATFIVRTTLAGVGVEKIYPLHSPMISKVDVISSPKKVHRANLYYIRNISKKEIRRKLGDVVEKFAAPEAPKTEPASAESKGK